MRSIAAVVCALLAAAAFADSPQDSSVTLPLAQFEELKKSNENASATVIDMMTLGGSFKDRNLTVTFAGRSVGTRTATNVISEATDVTLSGCSGEAMILRSGRGTYQLVALGPSFSVRCDVRLSGSDRLPMNVQPSVLAVRSAVTDGELVAGDEDDTGARSYKLVRQVVGPNETLATTATGRYLITLLPDTTRFRYEIQVHNPNRGTSPLPLKLVSGEHLQQIDSSAPYEVKDGSYVFAMPPGDSTITLSGELQGTSFAAPVAASLQYAVIESHPLLRPSLQSAPKRVSTGETGISTEFRGALAFEIGQNERITWSVTRLEALRAISYAVRSTTHTLFIPANGPILGESQFNLDNQGAPDFVLQPKPEPTFISLQNEPVLMTKNAKGELTVPLSAGAQQVLVQYRQRIPHLGFLFGSLDVPRVPVPATNTNVQLRYPAHWLPLWQSFATEGIVWRPEPGTLIAFFLLALWIERVLAFLDMTKKARVATGLLLAFAAGLVPTVLWIVVLSCAFITLVWVAANRRNWTRAQIAGAVLASAVVVFIGLAYIASSKVGSASRKYAEYENSMPTDTAMTVNAANDATRNMPAGLPPQKLAENSLTYQGLPAKFELPSGDRSTNFNEQLLAADRPLKVTVLLLSMTVVTWASAVFTLIALFLLWRDRAAIRSGLRTKLAAVTAVPETPAAA